MSQSPAFAFFVNFVLLDGLLYLFFVSLFFALSRHDVPSKEVILENYFHHVSHSQQLVPRRPRHIVSSLPLQGVSNDSESPFPYIPYVRKIVIPTKGRQYKVINHVSTREPDAVEPPGRNGVWLETLRKNDKRLVKVENFHPVRSEFYDVACTHSSPAKPCSSSAKTFYVNGRFNYLKNSY